MSLLQQEKRDAAGESYTKGTSHVILATVIAVVLVSAAMTVYVISGEKPPADRSEVSMTTLIPAFVLSELKSAFIIGLVIFIPFLVLDMLVSASLMAMGMMMVPPTIVSLPFKLLLFVVVDGWALITTALVGSYGGGG